ncbi:ParM/StbA family protein [Geoalkalibacter subterraneus]|uniref:Uncharacterized protein n=1 Tax=Geoalkalibacter subterraneus TaxID=483547 RepID=A0A0B5FVI7_9BACT|nr:ParM/StbA family protein [Geoalkalibacter subterraneus]AJF08185.1 hypothetical protein GSUB_16965 [Geoalkalibacter subterraneus]
MFVVGIDIGYSNLKVCSGEASGSLVSQVFPVGAAPQECFAGSVNGNSDGFCVKVEEKKYISCVEPDKLANWQRALHEEYATTPTYKALFLGGLMSTQREVVDSLVTGLPVSHFQEPGRKENLARRLNGVHTIDDHRIIDIRNVEVIPQPVGCYFDVAVATGREEEFIDADILVIDPGFFSVDWVLISGNDVQYRFSGSSVQATSMLLESAAEKIGADHDAKVTVEKIEKAIRAQRETIRIFGNRVPYAPYLNKAAETMGATVMDTVKTSLRSKAGDVDIVILAGGGAQYYRDAVSATFPKAEILLPSEPVLTNARGYWYYGLPA